MPGRAVCQLRNSWVRVPPPVPNYCPSGGMADTLDLGSSALCVRVRVSPWVP
jgi:hypothetical protein